MWYKNNFRRHLCDMHIDDWNDEFLSKFSPEEYFENLKKAKIQNAMIYFQSHVGLCYYPTKSGKMHNAFLGREDMMKRLVHMCRNEGIAFTGYYSLMFNNWAYHNHPEWRLVCEGYEPFGGKNNFDDGFECASNDINRYGICCPNNTEYRAFVYEQIKEMLEYFDVDGMFYDMSYWPGLCHCSTCQARFKEETGYDLPEKADWNDPLWLLHIRKRREWIDEFVQSVTDLTKKYVPSASVEHNVAYAVQPYAEKALAEGVLNACDYVGADLYGGFFHQSFACKFFRSITKNQPFECMVSRCEPNLSTHTITKSENTLKSEVFITAAHHGANLVIDAIDPVGTLDSRVYERLGKVFESEIPYEKYFTGEMIEDVGIYYTLRSKFNAHDEPYANHYGCVNSTRLMIENNICCGVTGGYRDISKYSIIIAPCLTEEDKYDFDRIVNYVKDGGKLYISGGDCKTLLKEFFGAEISGRTRESIVYIAPKASAKAADAFGWFNEDIPLQFAGTAPIATGIDEGNVIATVTLPYTAQNMARFASIHSNPPGIKTDIPALVSANYGKGKVLWSALPIENIEKPYQYGDVFVALLRDVLGFEQTVKSDAPEDVEIVSFHDGNEMTISAVQHCKGEIPRKLEPFTISVKACKAPAKVLQLPEEKECDFKYENGTVTYEIDNLNIFDMKKIIL